MLAYFFFQSHFSLNHCGQAFWRITLKQYFRGLWEFSAWTEALLTEPEEIRAGMLSSCSRSIFKK
jgi:hypothetical protein